MVKPLFAILSASLASTGLAMPQCSIANGQIELGPQGENCCAAAGTSISRGAHMQGMGGLIAKCHAEAMDPKLDCKPGTKDPTDEANDQAMQILCCTKDPEGNVCGEAILEGFDTGRGAMNPQVKPSLDADNDKKMDMCTEGAVVCEDPAGGPKEEVVTAAKETDSSAASAQPMLGALALSAAATFLAH